MCNSRIPTLGFLILLTWLWGGAVLVAEHSDERNLLLSDPTLPLWIAPGPNEYRVRMETTKGEVTLSVSRPLAPKGADRFYHLVKAGFYDDSRFFRVVSGKFAQFGIPGKPSIARIWRNRSFPDDPVKAHNVRGSFAFAMTGPNARTTQIYINTGDQSRLDQMGFSPLGNVSEGLDVIDHLYSGYGETSGGGMRAGHQDKLFEGGNAYLDREFPLLDRMIRCELMSN